MSVAYDYGTQRASSTQVVPAPVEEEWSSCRIATVRTAFPQDAPPAEAECCGDGLKSAGREMAS